ncbi:unnamed protein product [Aphanomyces euteiches]|uniref:Elicitin-like protein n=1 Tax=Aphanomyces euteiches TaxID=100861 RepID=A0A6G0WQD7_9STRA|nr:hypothetical protein Ae201684_012858 [Aphanomyces euteiches]KAH9097833.1 hypothetical protein Ae201684P_001307 [Aphanomyces euteiches]
MVSMVHQALAAVFLGCLALVSATACESNVLFVVMVPLAARYPACEALTNFSFTDVLVGKPPTADQATAMRKIVNCTDLARDIKAHVASLENCTIQGQSTADVAKMDLPDVLQLLVTSLPTPIPTPASSQSVSIAYSLRYPSVVVVSSVLLSYCLL